MKKLFIIRWKVDADGDPHTFTCQASTRKQALEIFEMFHSNVIIIEVFANGEAGGVTEPNN